MMVQILFAIFSFLGAAATFLTKHPLVIKMIMFPLFLTLIMESVKWFASYVRPYLEGNSALGYAAYFGALDGITLYLGILTVGFLVRMVLRFVTVA